jgi:hypothetical protein
MFGSKSRRIAALDAELFAARRQVNSMEQMAMEYARSANYYRELIDLVLEHFGEEAYICDDGSLSDEPLRAKVVDLVSGLVRKLHVAQVLTRK